jgi:hypothetical protein
MFNLFPLYVIARRDFIVLASFFLAKYKGADTEGAALAAHRASEVLAPLLTTKEYPHG